MAFLDYHDIRKYKKENTAGLPALDFDHNDQSLPHFLRKSLSGNDTRHKPKL
jgi:hypothetical protein